MTKPTVNLVTLGCARNEVDSEELAARLDAGGFSLVGDVADADMVVVNTCGFIEQAKKDSIDTLLEASSLKDGGRTRSVVAVGCLAERYGAELAADLPEADAVLGFDAYPEMADRLRAILSGAHPEAHQPRDRRQLLPVSPVQRPKVELTVPGHAPASGPIIGRRRLANGPSAPLKIASGCDRRCAFCAIPSFRGSFLSRPSADLLAEARWLVDQGVKEVFLVSENTTSYGKDLADPWALESLLSDLSRVDGLSWIRVSYLQPAEIRPGMIEAIAQTEKVVPYFDLSFQHASQEVLRSMRRFGDPDSFLKLIERIRGLAPTAGIRSNFIAGFPGETEADLETLAQFLEAARLDVAGVFGYSDEDGTEAAQLPDHLSEQEIDDRRAFLADLAEQLCDQRAADRIGEVVEVLIEGDQGFGRAAHQAPETDGITTVVGGHLAVGGLVSAKVIDTEGVDLLATPA